MERVAWWSSEVWRGWGWNFAIGWGLVSVSFRPVFFPSTVGDLTPRFTSSSSSSYLRVLR